MLRLTIQVYYMFKNEIQAKQILSTYKSHYLLVYGCPLCISFRIQHKTTPVLCLCAEVSYNKN